MYRESDNYQIDFYQYFFLKITFSNKQKIEKVQPNMLTCMS